MIVIVSVSWFGQAYAATMEVSGADSTNSVTLSWTAPADDGDVIESGPCAVYDLRYARDSITPLNWHLATPVVGEPVPTTPGSDQLMLVTGLTPGTRYYWGLKAADETYYLPEAVSNPDTVNWSELSNVVMKGTSSVILIGDHFVGFVGQFTEDSRGDVGLWDTLSGDWYIGKQDPITRKFIVSSAPVLEGWAAGGGYRLLIGKFHGQDALDDLCVYHAATGRLFVAQNQGNGTSFVPILGSNANGSWLSGWKIGDDNDYIPYADDFSGDGITDVGFFQPIPGRQFVAYNQGSNNPPYFQIRNGVDAGLSWLDDWGDGPYGTYWPFTGKLSGGDAFADVGCYHPATGRWFPAANTGTHNQFIRSGLWLDGWASGSSTTWKFFCGKSSSDSNDDIIVYRPADGKVCVAYNQGTYFVQANGAGKNGAWLVGWAVETGGLRWQVFAVDISGDEYIDLVAYTPKYGRWFVVYNWIGPPPYFAKALGGDEANSWLTNWGIQSGGAAKVAAVDAPDTLQSGTAVPADIELNQNYPNPFNPSTTISFSLPEAAEVTLRVYNILGQEVALLVDRQTFSAGNHSVEWNAGGKATGVYIYHLETGTTSKSNKMLLLK